MRRQTSWQRARSRLRAVPLDLRVFIAFATLSLLFGGFVVLFVPEAWGGALLPYAGSAANYGYALPCAFAAWHGKMQRARGIAIFILTVVALIGIGEYLTSFSSGPFGWVWSAGVPLLWIVALLAAGLRNYHEALPPEA